MSARNVDSEEEDVSQIPRDYLFQKMQRRLLQPEFTAETNPGEMSPGVIHAGQQHQPAMTSHTPYEPYDYEPEEEMNDEFDTEDFNNKENEEISSNIYHLGLLRTQYAQQAHILQTLQQQQTISAQPQHQQQLPQQNQTPSPPQQHQTPLLPQPPVQQGGNTNDSFNHEIFIEAVKKHSCLWNVLSPLYKDQTKKKLAWKNILEELNDPKLTVDYLKSQWKSLRENYKRCLSNRRQQTKSGAAAKKLSTCKYFANLCFLSDSVTNNPTDSNVELRSPTSSSSNSEISTPVTHTLSKRPRPISNKKKREESVDLMLVNTLKEIQKTPTNIPEPQPTKSLDADEDSDSLFCRSLVSQLKSFSPRKNKLARLRVQQALFDVEFS